MPEQPLSTNAAYAARPTIRIDGQAQDRVTALLLSLELTEWEGGLSTLEARFSNIASLPDGGAESAFEDDRLLKLGAAIAVYSGEEASPTEIFRGTITGLEAELSQDAPPELTVLAEDAFQKARMKRRTKLHENVTLSDLVNTLAQTAGLTPKIDGLSISIGTRMQLNESDLAFTRRILRDYDADMQPVGTELHAAERGSVKRGEVELEAASQLTKLRVLVDLAHQVTEVTAGGWDPVQGQPVMASSRGAHAGPGQGTQGAQALQQTLGERSEHLAHLAVSTTAEAQALADAHFDQRARRFVTLEGETEGNPKVRVGTHVKIKNASPRFDNTYYVVKCIHRFDVEKGYVTAFEAEGAFYGGRT